MLSITEWYLPQNKRLLTRLLDQIGEGGREDESLYYLLILTFETVRLRADKKVAGHGLVIANRVFTRVWNHRLAFEKHEGPPGDYLLAALKDEVKKAKEVAKQI